MKRSTKQEKNPPKLESALFNLKLSDYEAMQKGKPSPRPTERDVQRRADMRSKKPSGEKKQADEQPMSASAFSIPQNTPSFYSKRSRLRLKGQSGKSRPSEETPLPSPVVLSDVEDYLGSKKDLTNIESKRPERAVFSSRMRERTVSESDVKPSLRLFSKASRRSSHREMDAKVQRHFDDCIVPKAGARSPSASSPRPSLKDLRAYEGVMTGRWRRASKYEQFAPSTPNTPDTIDSPQSGKGFGK